MFWERDEDTGKRKRAVNRDAVSPRRVQTLMVPEAAGSNSSFAEVFGRVFHKLTELHGSFPRDGLLAVAVWNGEAVVDYLHVPLAAEPEFAVIGRHDRCDLSLALDAGMSLRHAVIGVRARDGELRVRLLDLQSGSGFHTEDGRRCEALTADGAMFVRAGSYHLFLLPTGSLWALPPWTATAEDTWKSIPERVYRDARVPARSPAALAEGRVQPSGPLSIITQIVHPPGMLRPHRPPAGALGAVVAEIELGTPTASERFSIHDAELTQGLLIGRYDRCQLGTRDEQMSRVHLLVITDGDDVWAIDTASTNGTACGGQAIRRTRLIDGAKLVLAQGIALRWTSSQ